MLDDSNPRLMNSEGIDRGGGGLSALCSALGEDGIHSGFRANATIDPPVRCTNVNHTHHHLNNASNINPEANTSAKGEPVGTGISSNADWARLVTIEERTFIRNKIRAAYQRKAPTYEELLHVACSIEEEYVFLSSQSRLDYFKSGVQYEKRVAEKLRAGDGSCGAPSSALCQAVREASSENLVHTLKRAKTQH